MPKIEYRDDCKSGLEALARARRGFGLRREMYRPRPIMPAPVAVVAATQEPRELPAPPAIVSPPLLEPPAVSPADDDDAAPLPMILDVIRVTAAYFGLTVAELRSDVRIRNMARARQIAMYLAVEMTGRSTNYVGRSINRDHSTVIYAYRKIKNSEDCAIASTIEGIKTRISAELAQRPATSLPAQRPKNDLLRWSEDDFAALRRMWADGLTPEAIAEAMERSLSAILTKARKMKLGKAAAQ